MVKVVCSSLNYILCFLASSPSLTPVLGLMTPWPFMRIILLLQPCHALPAVVSWITHSEHLNTSHHKLISASVTISVTIHNTQYMYYMITFIILSIHMYIPKLILEEVYKTYISNHCLINMLVSPISASVKQL